MIDKIGKSVYNRKAIREECFLWESEEHLRCSRILRRNVNNKGRIKYASLTFFHGLGSGSKFRVDTATLSDKVIVCKACENKNSHRNSHHHQKTHTESTRQEATNYNKQSCETVALQGF